MDVLDGGFGARSAYRRYFLPIGEYVLYGSSRTGGDVIKLAWIEGRRSCRGTRRHGHFDPLSPGVIPIRAGSRAGTYLAQPI